ncbi:Smr/MutS family protein [Hyphococcus formosus]|uniref:Smr/MutS family protein n=1 Tax=Hyphococcus formosus TaxID=3143534 RepID=UPI00398A9CB5
MKRRRHLTGEEEALWRKVTKDVSAYRPQKQEEVPLVSSSQHRPTASAKHQNSAYRPDQRPIQKKSGPTPNPMGAGDPRMDRLAGRGRIAIDAVLDLHGHNQVTARMVLHNFIREGHARGAKCLLVITGKGGMVSGGLVKHDAHDGFANKGRGVLRGRFQDWLSEDSVRRFISRSSSAHQRHGGDGAFYVFLKR